ncbi:MAG: hypothetical protein A2498_05575 [Lentisphaerae bacterium RIFOXYC12_FULL_60_16]|nr:MAG: hypothetical protein A2498_05575 [Lentisphaerae bacterium RIFOXYC12_FULL_60_16]
MTGTRRIPELVLAAQAGDKAALRELRASGYFEALKARKEGIPLLPAQRGMWTLHHLGAGEAGNYNISGAYRIRGPLRETVLEAAGRQLIARHDALRADFTGPAEAPRQRIRMEVPFSLETVDLVPGQAESPATRQAVRAAADRAFDLTIPPLLRMHLFRLSGNEHILLLVMHHIIGDGWSVGIVMQELAALYAEAVTGIPAGLPEPGSWHRAVSRQTQRLASTAFEPVRQFWRDALSPLPEPIDLPADRSRPATPSYTGASILIPVPPVLVAAIQRLASDTSTSAFVVLDTAVKALCFRLTGHDDLLTTFPFSGREDPGDEQTVGLFMRTLPLRLRVREDASFRDWLGQARDALLAALEHQPYALDMAIQDHPSAADPAVSPFTRVMVVMQEAGQTTFHLPGLETEEFDTGHYPALLDLVFEYSPGTTHTLRIHYRTDRYDEARIRQLGASLFQLITAAAAHPDQRVESLPMLADTERHRVLHDFNQPFQSDLGSESAFTFPDLIVQRARKTPEHIAIRFHDQSVTYREFERRSARIAGALIRLPGWKPEARAAVMIERSPDLPMLLVGIQRAGGCYLPIEPGLPPERIAGLLKDAGCTALFVEEATRALVPDGFTGTLLHTGDLPEMNDQPLPAILPDHLAYMIYTSGSTGKPKGVLVEHRGFVNLALALRKRFDITAADRVLQFASCSFDASVFDMAMAYGAGAQLVMIDRATLGDSGAFAAYLREQKVTMATLPPSFVEALPPSALEPLRFLMTAGEAARTSSATRYRKTLRFVNGYGPTETTVCAAWYEVSPDEILGERIPIGQPVFNHQITILDRWGNPCGIGQPGEICISGIGVARGYHNRADLTAAAFVTDPFRPGNRMYRTGDKGAWQADGTVCFLGRLDDQVKLRGFRIEPGEIEKALEQLPGIREAAVVLCQDPRTGERTLCGCYRSTLSLEPETLAKALARTLPAYMVPTLLRPVESWPLATSGKIDRKRLAFDCEAALRLTTGSTGSEAPQGDREIRIAAVWQSILGLDRVGRDDNFFQVGGDSIRAIRLAHGLREAGFTLSASDLFAHPTVAGLAGLAAGKPQTDQSPGIVDQPGPVAASPIQQWFFAQEQKPGVRNWFNQSVCLEFKQHLTRETLASALNALLEHHGALRLRLRDPESNTLSILAPDEARIPLNVIPLPGPAEADRVPVALKDQQSLDLVAGPLVRATLMDSPGKQLLLITAHHLCIDAVSWRILCEDLGTALGQISRGHPVQLPPVTVGWRQWVDGERQASLQTGTPVHEPGPAILPLTGLEFPAGEREEGACRIHRVALSPETTAGLRQAACRSYRCRWREMILHLLSQSLCKELKVDSLTIALEGHGREARMGLNPERVVGWFTALDPLTFAVGRGSATAALHELQDQLRALPRTRNADLLNGSATRLPAILFHDLGMTGADEENEWFRLKDSPPVPAIHPEYRRSFALEIVAETHATSGFELTLSGPQGLKALMEQTGQSFLEATGNMLSSLDQRRLVDRFDYAGFRDDHDLLAFVANL